MYQKKHRKITPHLLGIAGLMLAHSAALYAQSSSTLVGKDTVARTFKLGEVSVYGNQRTASSNVITAERAAAFGKNDVAEALNLLPGVNLAQIGPRNEALVSVRGFDLRSVPVLIDGIPVYVPYDGYVDLARFTTFDLAELQLAKGYTSSHYGPNSMGGAINLVTLRPVKKLELNGATGWLSGGFRSNINVGSNLGKYYMQAGISKLKRNFFPLSNDFVPTIYEDGGVRDNAYSDDEKISFKLGFTPDEKSEYAIGYSYQHGQKGNPLYTGNDPQNALLTRPRYWQWPKWDKQSVYFLSNTAFRESQYLKSRLYYDQFNNILNSYDDGSFSSMTRPYAFSSLYNDYTFGGIVEYGQAIGQRDRVSISAQYKQDVHRENNVGEPQRSMADGTFTLALENKFDLTEKLWLLTGLSYNKRQSIRAEDYDSDTGLIRDFPSNSNQAFNIQGALQYLLSQDEQLSLSIARKTRFATTKDRYSYRMGTALPNPDLLAEYAVNYDFSYKKQFFADKLHVFASLFYSDINNTILMVPNVAYQEDTDIFLSQLQNIGKTRNMWLEVGADYRPINPLTIGGNYTHVDRKNITDPTVFLTDVPKHKWIGYASYELPQQIALQLHAEYNSGRYSTPYGTETAPYTVLHGSVNVHVWRSFSLQGGVNNILDRNYMLVEGYPEAGRNYFANLIYRL
ncbi:TonB-dependent receptor plug domain-containing protein [Sphingobacterium oryzagri]|uniref:TonB-dependent receptor plug domain-containing protein n=1 Tax=Sphingobacterium oryzagri TaxID=3025669 RepID=A0ABY7WD77_9SPHI|nr:TonB-dependent receptor plug domain-containing protein [Sphingobacterium sp. KACC 22765]WDF66825.1 TonB-dependent receptor plug domain-containing protein [Sphingobacterium sp. KACC 22765]